MKALIPFALSFASTIAHSATYDIESELDATHCEIYVDSLGVGDIQSPDHPARFLDIYLRVNEHELVDLQSETILAVGAVVKARSFTATGDRDGKALLDILEFVDRVYANRVAAGSWQLRYRYEERIPGQSWIKEAQGLAFFVDVQRTTGRIQRLWLKNKNDFFSLEGLFAADPGSETSIGIGRIRFPANDAPIYRQKAHCNAH